MKSFANYPADFEKMLFPDVSENSYSGKLIAHYELYRKVRHLEGSVVKCGLTAEEGVTSLALFRNLVASPLHQPIVAFERFTKKMYCENACTDTGHLRYKTTSSLPDIDTLQQVLKQKSITEQIDFIPGNVGDSIPDYLMENPDLKISYLSIDFDDYESTLNTLQFFYPRIVHGGILILDNYYKNEEDYTAANDYFLFSKVTINNFSVNMGPHYVVIT